MIIVTGGAGFIGSNLVRALNREGHTRIWVVDDLTDGKKFSNLVDCEIADYSDYRQFEQQLLQCNFQKGDLHAVFHQGACSTTTEWNGRYMLETNFDYSKWLLHYCKARSIPFIYASSAAVYGNRTQFDPDEKKQQPLNVYGYSKWLFDQYVLQQKKSGDSQVVGLRYFNVFGPHESHKGSMASVAYHLTKQLLEKNQIQLFEGSDGYGPGEQRRDFVAVEDVAQIILWMWKHPEVQGIFNVGTGVARTFNEVAHVLLECHGHGECIYIPFPKHLEGCYQSFTQADIRSLRAAGCTIEFTPLEIAVARYYQWITKH